MLVVQKVIIIKQYIHIYIYIYISIYIYTHIHIYVCVYIYIYNNLDLTGPVGLGRDPGTSWFLVGNAHGTCHGSVRTFL